jgi:hypothetical protein
VPDALDDFDYVDVVDDPSGYEDAAADLALQVHLDERMLERLASQARPRWTRIRVKQPPRQARARSPRPVRRTVRRRARAPARPAEPEPPPARTVRRGRRWVR